MKKLTLVSALALFCSSVISTGLNAQTTALANKKETTPKTSVKEEVFMERYYNLKESYPALTNLHGAFAASSNAKTKFMERYYAIKAS